jgi:arginine-tRNA-protein transferase
MDSDEDPPVPNPNAPIWERAMPGILTKTQLLTEIDLNKIKLQIEEGGEIHETGMLVNWDITNTDDMDNPHSTKRIVAEIVAAAGVEIAKEMVVSFN